MLPLFFLEQGATAPVGKSGGITMTASTATNGQPAFTATPWFGGTNLGSITHRRYGDAMQAAMIIMSSYWANKFYNVDPDN